jgi:hypothetical protein
MSSAYIKKRGMVEDGRKMKLSQCCMMQYIYSSFISELYFFLFMLEKYVYMLELTVQKKKGNYVM